MRETEKDRVPWNTDDLGEFVSSAPTLRSHVYLSPLRALQEYGAAAISIAERSEPNPGSGVFLGAS